MSNLLEKASILTTPTAYDDGKILSVKPNTSAGDFDFTRNSSATRVNAQGLVEDVQILSSNLVQNGDFSQEGAEQVTNGDFSNGSTDWSVVGLATISNSVASFVDNGTNGNAYINQNVFTVGKFYRVTFDITRYVAGRIQLQVNSLYSVDISGGVGTYTTYVKSDNIRLLIKRDGAYANYDFDIDNVSVKEVGQDWTITDSDANNYVEFGDGTARLKFLNTSPITSFKSDTALFQGGKKYKLTVDVKEVVSGAIKIDAAGVSELFNSVGIQERIIEPSGDSNISFYRATANVDVTLNSVSLIEITDDTNLPRINYTNFDYENGEVVPYSGEGSLLLEPQSTNLITYSEQFDNAAWNANSGVLIESGYEAPDGSNNAYKITKNGEGSKVALLLGGTAPFSKSIYAKTVSGTGTAFFGEGSITGNGVLSTVTTQWQRFEITVNDKNFYGVDFRGGSTLTEVLIWGAQMEEGSYATSYIPTEGSIKTRLQDAAFGAGSSDLINSTEGVLYAEIAALADDGTNRIIGLFKDGDNGNRINIFFTSGSNKMKFVVRINNTNVFNTTITLSDIANYNKLALSFKENEFKVYINGVKEVEQLSGSIYPINTLDKLNFDQSGGTFPFYGKTKCLAVFKEALTDEELTCLTTI